VLLMDESVHFLPLDRLQYYGMVCSVLLSRQFTTKDEVSK
jgi:hypothetical protein